MSEAAAPDPAASGWRPALARWLDHPRHPALAALAAVVLALPALLGGMAADDWFHRGQIDLSVTVVPHTRGPILDLFAFFPADAAVRVAQVDTGILPWWTQSDVRGAFFRPLTAVTHIFDWRVIGDVVWVHHAHTLLWLAASVLAAGWFFRTWLGEGRTAALATFLFAVEDAHAWPAAWLANRNALLAMTFGAMTAAAHLCAARGSVTARVATPPLLALALLSAEAGSATLLLLAVLEFGIREPVRRRVARLLPLGVVAAAWAFLWRWLGYGIHGSGLYVDPIGSTAAFLAGVPERVGALSGALWLNLPVDFWVVLPTRISAPLGLAFGLAATAAVVIVALPTLRGSPRAREAVAIGVVCLLPACAAFPMERVVTFAGFGGLALVALVTAPLLDGGGRMRDQLALFWHGPVSALLFLAKCIAMPRLLSQIGAVADAVPDDAAVRAQDLVIVSGFELATAYIPITREIQRRPLPRGTLLLAPASTFTRVTREDDRTLRLDFPQGAFRHSIERLCRDSAFAVGETVTTRVATVEVIAVDTDALPMALRVSFPRSIDSPDYRWLAPGELSLQPWQPPALGDAVDVPPLIELF